jgi:hypothetical protein
MRSLLNIVKNFLKVTMTTLEAAYIAGLFDGEGSITYKKYFERKKKGNKVNRYECWRIVMEITMTDKFIIDWVHSVLGCGTVRKKPRKNGHKMQYRWRCCFRDAFHVCCVLFPYAHVKLNKISQIIDHYSTTTDQTNIIKLSDYRGKNK